jgi:MFS family permease
VHLRHRIFSGRSTLWSNRDFLHLWSAETISQFGSQLGLLAIPLIAALVLDASPLEMGILTAAGQAPRLLIGFFAGAWVDRLPRKPIMVVTDIGRALTYAVIPVAWFLDGLSIELLLLVAAIEGCQTVFFNAAWSAIIPGLVQRKHLADANGKLMASVSLAQVTGPALAGTLIAWLSGPVVMWITSATFGLSAWFLQHIRKPETRRERDEASPTRLIDEVREGFRELMGSRIVRPLTTSSMVINLGGNMFMSVYVLYMAQDLGLSSRGIGLVYASGGVGALIASMIAAPMAARFGVGRIVLWSAAAFGLANLFVPLAILVPEHALPLIIFSEMAAWMSLQVFNVNRFSLRQALTPDHLMGRVSSSTLTLVGGAQLTGSLLGGVIGQVFSVHVALFVSVGIMALAAGVVWASAVPSIGEMPDGPEVAAAIAD